VVQAFSGNNSGVAIHKTMPFRKRRQVPDAEWKALLKILETAGASVTMIRQLSLCNGLDAG
jgi:hypothetical protein